MANEVTSNTLIKKSNLCTHTHENEPNRTRMVHQEHHHRGRHHTTKKTELCHMLRQRQGQRILAPHKGTGQGKMDQSHV